MKLFSINRLEYCLISVFSIIDLAQYACKWSDLPPLQGCQAPEANVWSLYALKALYQNPVLWHSICITHSILVEGWD